MISEFIHEEISIMDYNGLLWGGVIMDCQDYPRRQDFYVLDLVGLLDLVDLVDP